MLDIFRQKGITNLIYGVIMVATIFAFVVTFRPQSQARTASLRETCVANVRGRCIEPKDFFSAYRLMMPTRSMAMSRRLNLKRIALDGLVERELLDDEAKRLGIGVTDAELTDQLYAGYIRVSVPAADTTVAQAVLGEISRGYAAAGLLQTDVTGGDSALPIDFHDPKTKRFDIKVYERQVRNLSNRSTTEFREEQQRELLAAKMRDVIREPVRVSEGEAWAEYSRQNNSATVTWIAVKEAWAGRWVVALDAPAAVDAWIKEHQKEVDAQIEQRTKDDAPAVNHVRHILVKTPYGATDAEKAAAVAKLSWAASRVRAGESFAEVARETSDDTGTAVQGGDFGANLDETVPPFHAAAAALKPGEMTPVAVETQFGFHLIMKDDPSKAADVAAQVRRTVPRAAYAKARATDAAKLVAKRITEAMVAGKGADDALALVTADYVRKGPKIELLKILAAPPAGSDAGAVTAPAKPVPSALPAAGFDAASDTDHPAATTSSSFNRGGDPFPGLSPEGTTAVLDFAFTGKEGDVLRDPVRISDAFAIVALKERKTKSREEFATDRDTFEEGLLRSKRAEALSLYVQRLRADAKDSVKIDQSFVQEVRADGGASSATDEEDEY
jgi:peptidyl-prolyl cis-trans isomerase D